MKAPGSSTAEGTLSRSDASRRGLERATPGQDSQNVGARRVMHQAELLLADKRGACQSWRPKDWQRWRRASLYLAADRWKLVRGDWQAAMLLASKAIDVALGVPGRADQHPPDPLGLRWSGETVRHER